MNEYSKRAFHPDGSLRDIYVKDTNDADWEAFCTFLKAGPFTLSYTRDGIEAPVPLEAAAVAHDCTCSHCLCSDIGEGVKLHCHFFIPDEIELDVDPREVTHPGAVDAVLGFLADMGAHLSRDVILTEENDPEHVWFRYASDEGRIRI
jgi:hypothetical protein